MGSHELCGREDGDGLTDKLGDLPIEKIALGSGRDAVSNNAIVPNVTEVSAWN